MAEFTSMLKACWSIGKNAVFKGLTSRWLTVLRRCAPASLRHGLRDALKASIHRDFAFVRTREWMQQSAPLQGETSLTKPWYTADGSDSLPALDIYGYFSRWLGLGECARVFAHALIVSGNEVALHDVNVDSLHPRRDHSLVDHFSEAVTYENSLVFVNPDHFDDVLSAISQERRRIFGYWFWELERFPAAWLPALDKVDGILVSSRFVECAIKAVSDKPVRLVPIPLSPGTGSGLERAHFGLRDEDYVFLYTFDFSSTMARKNPGAVVDAFRLAFPAGDERACLLLKSGNGQQHMEWLMSLLRRALGDRRILVRDDMLDRDDLWALQRCCDAYVSLHRCEGFGLGIAEAMSLGKPVVATGYSGNMDYMTIENSCPVHYRMMPVSDGEYPHASGQHWAEPDVYDAARHMRRLYEDRSLGRRLGDQAAIDIARDFSPEASLRALAQCLKQNEGGFPATAASGMNSPVRQPDTAT